MEQIGAWLEKYGSEDLPIQQVTRYKAMENILKDTLGRVPTPDEVANKLTSYGFHMVKEINQSEIARVENILKWQNGGREPTTQELERYLQ